MLDISDEAMDYDYVVENVLSNTDLFLENRITGKLKAWHLIFIVSAGTLVASELEQGFKEPPFSHKKHFIVITFCCFVRVRLPRTKSEIIANARRKALLKNFRSKLKSLKSADLDDMDYRRGTSKLSPLEFISPSSHHCAFPFRFSS